MGWTNEQFKEFCRRREVDAIKSFQTGVVNLNKLKNQDENRTRHKLPSSKPKLPDAMALEDTHDGKGKSSLCADQRVRVQIIVRRVRLCDHDNITGGCKPLIDGLRSSRLIKEDNVKTICLEVSQEQVKRISQEGVTVILTYPNDCLT